MFGRGQRRDFGSDCVEGGGGVRVGSRPACRHAFGLRVVCDVLSSTFRVAGKAQPPWTEVSLTVPSPHAVARASRWRC